MYTLKLMAGEDILAIQGGYFGNSVDSGGDKTHSANQICEMVEFLIDNNFVKFRGHHFARSLEFQWVPTEPPSFSLLTAFFILTEVIF